MKTVKRTWNVNGALRTVSIPPARRLLDVIRQDLNLKGTKEGCGEGECGACTILLNGEPVVSCLIPAGQVPDGARILTIEGLEQIKTGKLLQEAYIAKGAAQCGFCIPGMLLSSHALLAQEARPKEKRIREALAGNLCRCTGYKKIVAAVQDAARQWPAARRAPSPAPKSGGRSSATPPHAKSTAKAIARRPSR